MKPHAWNLTQHFKTETLGSMGRHMHTHTHTHGQALLKTRTYTHTHLLRIVLPFFWGNKFEVKRNLCPHNERHGLETGF